MISVLSASVIPGTMSVVAIVESLDKLGGGQVIRSALQLLWHDVMRFRAYLYLLYLSHYLASNSANCA